MSIHPYEMPKWEALGLIEGEHLGRLCILDGETPITLPVNYRFISRDHRDQVVVRTAATSLIGRYRGRASLEVDRIDSDAMTAWSILLRGELEQVGGDHGLPDPEPWLGGRHTWMALTVDAVSGRRFVGTRRPDGYSVEWAIAGS